MGHPILVGRKILISKQPKLFVNSVDRPLKKISKTHFKDYCAKMTKIKEVI